MFIFEFFKFLNTCTDGRAAAYMLFTIFVLLSIFTVTNTIVEHILRLFLYKKDKKNKKEPEKTDESM